MMPRRMGLYAILDLPHPHGLDPLIQLEAILEGAGASLVLCQLRAKSATPVERRAVLERLAPACLAAGVPLVVNDDLELALAGIPGTGGVHLGQGDPGIDEVLAIRGRAAGSRGRFQIGISTHDTAQLRAAIAQRPDYIAYGPVLATRSKAHPDPVVGFDGLADACRIAPGPVVAIGGLDPAGAARAIEVGAAMVAVIGGLVRPTARETAAAARAYATAIAGAAQWLDVDEVHARIPVMSIASLTEIATWAEDLAVLATLRLPTRFRPRIEGGVARYRSSDVCDLLAAIGKRDDESWADWRARGDLGEDNIVLLRRGR
jgi:thiamine-phosphate pyrophosphorylase